MVIGQVLLKMFVSKVPQNLRSITRKRTFLKSYYWLRGLNTAVLNKFENLFEFGLFGINGIKMVLFLDIRISLEIEVMFENISDWKEKKTKNCCQKPPDTFTYILNK